VYDLLLSPFRIRGLTLPNRIVMPPMVTFLAGDDGLVTQTHRDHYEQSAGPGLIVVEGTAVLPEGRIDRRQLGIYSDGHVEGLSELAGIIHSAGAVAGIQIHHAGATAFAEARGPKTYRRIPPTLVRLLLQQFATSRLVRIRDAFKDAGRRAAAAGFDIIELHAAHGYLFSQLLSPLKNRRLDRYGGSIENRSRFLFEVFQAVQEEVGDRALVTARIGVVDGQKGGLTLSDGLSVALRLQEEGAPLLSVSCGSGIPGWVRPEGSPYSPRLHLAARAKSVLQVPVIGGGGVRRPELAEQALRDGMSDLVYVGQAMLADPGWARKVIEGQEDMIVACRGCGRCFWFEDYRKCPSRPDAVDGRNSLAWHTRTKLESR